MKNKELIQRLEKLPPEAEVYFENMHKKGPMYFQATEAYSSKDQFEVIIEIE